jgi:hypothetical protein
LFRGDTSISSTPSKNVPKTIVIDLGRKTSLDEKIAGSQHSFPESIIRERPIIRNVCLGGVCIKTEVTHFFSFNDGPFCKKEQRFTRPATKLLNDGYAVEIDFLYKIIGL